MNFKTDFGYNEDDFVQVGEAMNELTVTITLCEYRNMIREQVQAAKVIELLQEKLKKAEETSKTFMQLFMFKSPETINKLCEIVNELFPNEKTEGANQDPTAKEMGVSE